MNVFRASFRGSCTDCCPWRDPTLGFRSCCWGVKILIIFGKGLHFTCARNAANYVGDPDSIGWEFFGVSNNNVTTVTTTNLNLKKKFGEGHISNVFRVDNFR